jgi:hypothetical protein
MQVTTNDLERVFAGKDVLGVLAGMLIVSGMTTASIFVDAGVALAVTAAHIAPALGGATEVVVILGIYLQAVVLAAVYRGCCGVYETLQRRRERVLSSA